MSVITSNNVRLIGRTVFVNDCCCDSETQRMSNPCAYCRTRGRSACEFDAVDYGFILCECGALADVELFDVDYDANGSTVGEVGFQLCWKCIAEIANDKVREVE